MSNFGLLVLRAVKEINEISLYGAEKIGVYAFRDCTNLESITIPNSVTSIGGYAFYGCTSLTDCTILKTDSIITNAGNNFNSTNNKIYVPYSLLSSYKNATNWVGITDKIMGYQTFTLNEVLPRYNTTHTFTWYPTKADLIANTNGIVADGTTRATSAGEWYCERPKVRVNLIYSEKSTSWTEPTSSTTKTENINFDRPANSSFPIYIKISVENNNKQLNSLYSEINPNNTTTILNYGTSKEFDNTKTNYSAWLKLYFNSTEYLRVENKTYYNSVMLAKAWQNITIHEAYQIIN